MALPKPTFTLTAGSLTSTTQKPVGGPFRLEVDRDMDVAADVARLHLQTRSDVALKDPVVLKLGADGDETTVFTGRVVALRVALDGVIVEALGAMNDLLDLRTAAMYEEKSAGDIVSALASAAGMKKKTVDSGPTLPRYIVDGRVSAYLHVRDLADRLGYEVYADRDGKLMFHALGAATGLDSPGGFSPSLPSGLGGDTYSYGTHLIAAQSIAGVDAWGKILVGAESPASNQGDKTVSWLTAKDTDFDGEGGSGKPERLYLDPVARTKDLATRFAKGRLVTANRRSQQVRFTTIGRPSLDLGDSVTVNKATDKQINGSGYLRAIRHRFDTQDGFITELRVCVAKKG